MVTSHMPPTGVLACNPGMCPDWELNLRPFGSQAGTQSTEPHQPGQTFLFLMTLAILRSTGQEYCKMPVYWNLSDVFLTIRLGLWVPWGFQYNLIYVL